MNILNANRNIDALTPVMAKRVRKWKALCQEAGLDILITETRRTQARQNYLYAFGRYGINRTKAKVTWTRKSNHIKGEAIDFVPLKNGKADWRAPAKIWDTAYDLAEEAGIESLFRKAGADRPHLNFDPKFVETPKWAEKGLKFALNHGLMSSDRPNDPVTRAELATIIERLYQLITK